MWYFGSVLWHHGLWERFGWRSTRWRFHMWVRRLPLFSLIQPILQHTSGSALPDVTQQSLAHPPTPCNTQELPELQRVCMCLLSCWDCHFWRHGATALGSGELPVGGREGAWHLLQWILHCRSAKDGSGIQSHRVLRRVCAPPALLGKLFINMLTRVKTRPPSYCQDQYILG